jgi:GntR family transcriptional regulator
MAPTTTRKDLMPRSAAGIGAGLSKHGLVAEALSSEIQGGKYKVGDLLPSEPQLSQRFGVSRHTVRAALQTLHRLGLVSSQQGVGTQVQETRLVSRYSHSFNSAEDLLQYATTTPVRVLDRAEVAVDATMAAQFGCKPGEHWWRVRTVRMDPSGRTVVAYSEIHIPLAFGAVLNETAKSRQPIFALIERRFKETILEIEQDIACIARMKAEEASHLQVPRNSPGMEITRRYIGRNGRVLEVARSVHPSEIFKYSMRVQLRHGSDT